MNPLRKAAIGGALAAAAITGGALGASFFGVANAATSSTTAPASSAPASPSAPSAASGSNSGAAPARPSMPAHGTAEHENAEKPVTGDNATKAQAAAVKSVGSGTAGAVTTDFPGTGYEVTVTKADGSQVEVHLDGSFNVQQGGPGGPHGPGRPNDNDADDTAGAPAAPAAPSAAG